MLQLINFIIVQQWILTGAATALSHIPHCILLTMSNIFYTFLNYSLDFIFLSGARARAKLSEDFVGWKAWRSRAAKHAANP